MWFFTEENETLHSSEAGGRKGGGLPLDPGSE